MWGGAHENALPIRLQTDSGPGGLYARRGLPDS
jgi:hypothetical protein